MAATHQSAAGKPTYSKLSPQKRSRVPTGNNYQFDLLRHTRANIYAICFCQSGHSDTVEGFWELQQRIYITKQLKTMTQDTVNALFPSQSEAYVRPASAGKTKKHLRWKLMTPITRYSVFPTHRLARKILFIILPLSNQSSRDSYFYGFP